MTEKVWFTADHHFGNEGVIKNCNRPFADVREMDEVMVVCWNDRVGHDDVVWYLADFTLKGRNSADYYFSRLNGDIKMLRYDFHHDGKWLKREGPYFSRHLSKSNKVVEFMSGVYLLKHVFPDPVALCHFPLAQWPRKHYGAWHLHGHSHGKHESEGAVLDVGVDCWDYTPVSAEEITAAMKTRITQERESEDNG